MDTILPRYNINIENDFVFLEKKELENFLHSDLHAHSHNYYILSFLYNGVLSHLSDFEQKQVSGPAILLLDKDQVHTHPDTSDCKIISIAFSTNFISDQQPQFLQKISTIFSRTFIGISSEELNKVNEIIKIMARESSESTKDFALIKALLNVLIVHCYSLSETYPVLGKNTNESYNGFKILLQENFRKQRQVKFYADQLNVTTATLNQSMKKSTLKTPKQLINEQLLLEAKRLLYWSNTPAKEVAWKLGFETDSYFNHFFKKHTGETPKEFQIKKIE